MSEIDSQPFPKGALIAAGVLLSVSVVATAAVRLYRISTPAPVAAAGPAALASVDLSFADMPDGSVAVRESGTGRSVATLAPGTNGFVRDVLRGLAHERMTRGLGAAPPFRLSDFGRERLVLEDTATGRRIDLQAFGRDNLDAFAHLMPRWARSESAAS